MNESDVKRRIVRSIKEAGGYARRIEDNYGVGIFDLLLIPMGFPVFAAEVKMVRGAAFAPTPRQYEELRRIEKLNSNNIIPVMIGYRDGVYYFHPPKSVIECRDCFSVTTTDMEFNDQLTQYYLSRRA